MGYLSAIEELARDLANQSNSRPWSKAENAFHMIEGIVVSVDSATTCSVSVSVAGTGAIGGLSGVRWVTPYVPKVNDVVVMLEMGVFRIILGAESTSPSLTGEAFVARTTSLATTDGAGYVNVTHGCPWVPTTVVCSPIGAAGGATIFAQAPIAGISTLTISGSPVVSAATGPTTFTIRCLNNAGSALATTSGLTLCWTAYQ